MAVTGAAARVATRAAARAEVAKEAGAAGAAVMDG